MNTQQLDFISHIIFAGYRGTKLYEQLSKTALKGEEMEAKKSS